MIFLRPTAGSENGAKYRRSWLERSGIRVGLSNRILRSDAPHRMAASYFWPPTERRLRLADRCAAAFHPRHPRGVRHAMADILRARIFATAGGHEDGPLTSSAVNSSAGTEVSSMTKPPGMRVIGCNLLLQRR